MLIKNAIRPEDILPDGLDSTVIHGKTVRKGTIASFLAHAELLERENITEAQKQDIYHAMKALAPAVVAIGLHKHVVFKNNKIEQLLVDAEMTGGENQDEFPI